MAGPIRELIANAESKLRELGFKESTIDYYKIAWRFATKVCDELGIDVYDEEVEARVLAKLGNDDYARLSRHHRVLIRYAKSLLTLERGSLPPKRVASESEEIPDALNDYLKDYISYLERCRLSRTTICNRSSIIRRFLISLKDKRIGDLCWDDVEGFINERCSGLAAQSKAAYLYVLRMFLRWLIGKGKIGSHLADMMPTIISHAHARIPSAYNDDEVGRALQTRIEGQCPKRDYAILTLGALCGMRVGDIRKLKLGDIDPADGLIRYRQAKTGTTTSVPLPKESAYAIADYLRYERPESDDEHVFLRSRAPLRSFADHPNNFHEVPTKALVAAGIDFHGRHHGMHAMRHSAATSLLSVETPYPVIGSVLGHESADVTRKYLAIDVEHLRILCLEVPHE